MTTPNNTTKTKKKRTNFEKRKLEANPKRLQINPNALLTSHDVADQLEVSEQTVRMWARLGHLDAIRLGHRTVRFTQAAVEKFLKAR
jgi:excisionase family DNA binding protein